MPTNMAFIYQPHFNTNCFRVAINDQRGTEYNYITVTCSPMYNGIWKYASQKMREYAHWKNGNIECVCVPIKDCVLLQPLDTIKSDGIRHKVKAQQEQWYKNKIKNRDYTYAKKPDWFI